MAKVRMMPWCWEGDHMVPLETSICHQNEAKIQCRELLSGPVEQ